MSVGPIFTSARGACHGSASQQVARARRRLVLEQFLGRLVWCLLGALTLAAVAVAVPRLIAIENLPANWDMIWLLGALGGGFVSAAAWTLISSRSPLDAAIEIDRRFDLRERIASSLSLTREEQARAKPAAPS